MSEPAEEPAPPQTTERPSSKRPRPSENFTARQSSYADSPGIENTLYKSLEHITFKPVVKALPSTFVPNAHVMYLYLHYCDGNMANNKVWSSQSSQWTPIYSRIYYGILFYIQTLRCMRQAGIILAAERVLLNHFEDSFPPESMIIIGPLVPFFSALCSSQPMFDEYGPVCPTLPRLTGCTAAKNGTLPVNISPLLPNMTALFRAIANARTPSTVAHVNRRWDYNLDNPLGNASSVGPSTAGINMRDAKITPGTVYDYSLGKHVQSSYNNCTVRIPMPSRPVNFSATTWTDYLGLDNTQWFEQLTAVMSTYSDHFKGNTTLGNISTSNGAAAQVVCHQDVIYADGNAHREAHIPGIDFTSIARSFSSEIGQPSINQGMFTAINYVPAPNFCPQDRAGRIGETRIGPWWDLEMERSVSRTYNAHTLGEQTVNMNFFMPKGANRL